LQFSQQDYRALFTQFVIFLPHKTKICYFILIFDSTLIKSSATAV